MIDKIRYHNGLNIIGATKSIERTKLDDLTIIVSAAETIEDLMVVLEMPAMPVQDTMMDDEKLVFEDDFIQQKIDNNE